MRDILGGADTLTATEAAPVKTDPTPGPKTVDNPSITGVPALGKTDPPLGSKPSITDIPGSVTDAGAPQRKSGPRLVNLGPDRKDPTDTDRGGRHRLENLGKLTSSWTPKPRKLHDKKDSTTTGNPAGSNSGRPKHSKAPSNDE